MFAAVYGCGNTGDVRRASCYESWHRPRPETYHDRDYIGRTIFEQQHGSILEHATATLYFTGVSRSFLTELTRHRMLSFSVRSQRFVDAGRPSTQNVITRE